MYSTTNGDGTACWLAGQGHIDMQGIHGIYTGVTGGEGVVDGVVFGVVNLSVSFFRSLHGMTGGQVRAVVTGMQVVASVGVTSAYSISTLASQSGGVGHPGGGSVDITGVTTLSLSTSS